MSPAIGGFTYKFTCLPADDGFSTWFDLVKMLAPSISSALSAIDLSKGLQEAIGAELDGAKLAVALERAATLLGQNASTPAVMAIVEKLAAATDIYGPGFGDAGAPLSAHYRDHFAGRTKAMLQWLTFTLKSQYSDFFEGLRLGDAARALANLAPQSPSPTTSTG